MSGLGPHGGLKIEGISNGDPVPVSGVSGGTPLAVTLATRLDSTNDSITAVGAAADDAAISGNPVRVGARAVSALPAAVVNGDTADLITDLQRRALTLPYANPENQIGGNCTLTDNNATQVIAAQAAGVRSYMTTLVVTNSHATVGTTVTIQDDAGSPKVLFGPQYAAPNGGGFAITFPVPPCTGAAQKLQAVAGTTGSNVYVSVVGFKAA